VRTPRSSALTGAEIDRHADDRRHLLGHVDVVVPRSAVDLK
jgi:hypothetical protein